MTGARQRRAFLRSGLAIVAGLTGAAAISSATQGRSSVRAPHATANFLVHTNLEYAPSAGRGHLLDLYLPLDAVGPVPVVIFQTGSAFRSDDTKGKALAGDDPERPWRGMIAPPRLASRWAPQGYAVVGLNVRSSSQAKFPGQVHDVKAAIRFLRAHAGEFGLDADRFATMGNSSGAWVSTMAALTSGIAELEGDLGHPEQSSAVQAAVDLFGPTDFLQMDAHRVPDGLVHEVADSPESELMGFTIGCNSEAVQKANPATYVRPDSPPVFITHGLNDPLVPAHQSQILFDAYEKAGATAVMTLVSGVKHTDAYLFDPNYGSGHTVKRTAGGATTTADLPAPTFATVKEFLDTHLGT